MISTTSMSMTPQRISTNELILSLQKKIEDMLSPLIPRDQPVALLDFPNYANVGDSAIWLGEKMILRRLGIRIVHSCDVTTYSRPFLSKRIGDGIILLQGGGNLGDLWPVHQEFRERIIEHFSKNKIIQLPQSIYFQNRENLKRAREVFNSHADFTLLVRDERSLHFARREFSIPSMLCPDMAFALDALPTSKNLVHDILCLMRTDQEALNMAMPPGYKGKMVDWLEDGKSPVHLLNRAITWLLGEFPRRLKTLGAILQQLYDHLAHSRLMRGIHELGQSRVVITDRLHGHILSLLLGIPHILLNNNYGKVRNFFETWTSDCNIVYWADSTEEAYELAKRLVKVSRECEI